MDKSEFARLVKRLKNGTATPFEREMLEKHWHEALNDNTGTETLAPSERRRLKFEMYGSISRTLRFEGQHRKLFFSPMFFKVAASLLLLVAITSLWYFQFRSLPGQGVSEIAFIEVQTEYGHRSTIKFPDGSSVLLNGNSKLKYAKNWSSSSPREVWINGEGFFAIQHTQNNQKFIVHTGEGLNVEVLGTKFNVKSRAQGSEVLLTEGRVKLNVASETAPDVFLKPGEMATMKEHKLSKRKVEGKQYTSWVRSKLYFDKMTLEELAQILRDTYGIEVSFQNEELKYRQLSGEISSASSNDILFAIAETFNVKVTELSKNSVIFSMKTNSSKTQ